MAGKSANENQLYIIALIVFVLLTFVLSVSNYFAYKWGFENQKTMEDAQKKESEANSKMRTAILSRVTVVRDVLGIDLDDIDTDNVEAILKQNEEILQRKKKDIDDVYGKNFGKDEGKDDGKDPVPPTYAKAVEWLGKSIFANDGKMKALADEKKLFDDERKKLAEEKDKEIQDEKKKLQAAQAELAELRKTFEEYEKTNTDEKNKLIADKKMVDEKVESLKAIGEEIAKCKDYLSGERKKQWPAMAEGDSSAGGEIQRIALLLLEMRDKDRTIARLNQVVSQIRVADPSLQTTVLAATPKDDRVDGFDGRILSVNELDRTVLFSVGSTAGIRAGLVFYVYDPADPQPQLESRKGVIEVVAIESDSLVRARVRQDATRDPLLPGDVVATSLWSPGTALEVVLVGVPQFGGDGAVDAERFKRLVERIGGTVETTVSPTTTMVVDGGIPRLKGIDPDRQATRKPMTEAEKTRRQKQLDEAKRLGIRVVAMEPFLGMMGLQLDAVGANRLPVPADQRAAPARP